MTNPAERGPGDGLAHDVTRAEEAEAALALLGEGEIDQKADQGSGDRADLIAEWQIRIMMADAGGARISLDLDEAREVLAALASPTSNRGQEQGAATLTDEMVATAMNDAWCDICADSGCHPVDIEQLGRRRLQFQPRHWAELTAMMLRSQLAEQEQGVSGAEVLDALQLILPLAKGYSPAGQTDTAKATCRSWFATAEDVIERAGAESRHDVEPCPACGALPCDWVNNPSETDPSGPQRSEAALSATDAGPSSPNPSGLAEALERIINGDGCDGLNDAQDIARQALAAHRSGEGG
jgi:hypothetical protein